MPSGSSPAAAGEYPLDELPPAAREYGEHHLAAYGLIGDMEIMALTLLLLR